MRTLLISIAFSLFTLSSAHAGGYLSLGMGSDAALGGEINQHFDTDDLKVTRLAVGTRIGPIAIEGVMSGADLRGTSNQILGESSGGDFSTTSLGIDVKYYVGLSGALEGYARGGINKTWLGTGSGTETNFDYSGRGYSVGGGLQYTFRLLPSIGGAIWADYNHQLMSLSDQNAPTISGTADMLTIGLSVGTGI